MPRRAARLSLPLPVSRPPRLRSRCMLPITKRLSLFLRTAALVLGGCGGAGGPSTNANSPPAAMEPAGPPANARTESRDLMAPTGAPTPKPPPYNPCAGKACGEQCRLCPPTDKDCNEPAVVKSCDEAGACTPTTPACRQPTKRYNPCAGKTCGQPCTWCSPSDKDCSEPAVVKSCDAAGACVIDAVCK